MREETKTNGDSPEILRKFKEIITTLENLKGMLSKRDLEEARKLAKQKEEEIKSSYLASRILDKLRKITDDASKENLRKEVNEIVEKLNSIVSTAEDLLLSARSVQADEGKKRGYEQAMEKAEKVAEALTDISKNKLREYFDQVKTLNTEVKMKKNPIEAKVEIRKAMMKLRARVYYDSARPGLGAVKDFRPIIDAFVAVMNKWGDKEDKDIKNDLQGFCDFLECLVGYHYVYAEK